MSAAQWIRHRFKIGFGRATNEVGLIPGSALFAHAGTMASVTDKRHKRLPERLPSGGAANAPSP
jgi:hypothetical protein